MGFQGNDTPPVREGDEVDVYVEAVGEKGDGICKVKGFVIFVPGVKEGENIKVRITKVLRKVGFGEKVGEGQAPEPVAAPEHPSAILLHAGGRAGSLHPALYRHVHPRPAPDARPYAGGFRPCGYVFP